MIITIPVKTVSEANQAEHWAKKHRRKKHQQYIATIFLRQAGIAGMKPSYIKLVRIAPWVRAKDDPKRIIRGRLDNDNLAGSFKHCQDSVARELEIDDGQIQWIYDQEDGPEHAVRVEIHTNGEPT